MLQFMATHTEAGGEHLLPSCADVHSHPAMRALRLSEYVRSRARSGAACASGARASP